MIVEAQILEAGRRLARAAPHARVILLGSHARGSLIHAAMTEGRVLAG